MEKDRPLGIKLVAGVFLLIAIILWLFLVIVLTVMIIPLLKGTQHLPLPNIIVGFVTSSLFFGGFGFLFFSISRSFYRFKPSGLLSVKVMAILCICGTAMSFYALEMFSLRIARTSGEKAIFLSPLFIGRFVFIALLWIIILIYVNLSRIRKLFTSNN